MWNCDMQMILAGEKPINSSETNTLSRAIVMEISPAEFAWYSRAYTWTGDSIRRIVVYRFSDHPYVAG
jgi:hypothetical protein